MGKYVPIKVPDGGTTLARGHKTRVMIVDDSITVRSILARLINSQSDLEVTGKSGSAEVALDTLKRKPADVVLLDLEMPGMGGLDALPKLLKQHPDLQVLVVSSLTEDGAEATLAALSMGAADTMPKPRSGEFGPEYCDTLCEKIRALGPDTSLAPQGSAPARLTAPKATLRRAKPELLAIGASTGGIHALGIFLRNLPEHIELPILVTQHLPDSFMSVFARQLELASNRKAVIAEDQLPIRSGHIYIAPGGAHLNVRNSGAGLVCKLTRESAASGCMPSVDPMLQSATRATEGRTIAVILSGMGKDGLSGASDLVDQGGTVWAQDEESSAVWGMPRAVAERSLASAVLPPADLARQIANYIGTTSWK